MITGAPGERLQYRMAKTDPTCLACVSAGVSVTCSTTEWPVSPVLLQSSDLYTSLGASIKNPGHDRAAYDKNIQWGLLDAASVYHVTDFALPSFWWFAFFHRAEHQEWTA